MASIPVLVDDASRLVLPESTTIIEYLDGLGGAPPLVPADPPPRSRRGCGTASPTAHVMTPMQKIVGDSLRPEGRRDPEGVARGPRARSTAPTRCSTGTSPTRLAGRARRSRWPTAPRRRRSTTHASCTAGTRRAWPPDALLRAPGRDARRSRGSSTGRASSAPSSRCPGRSMRISRKARRGGEQLALGRVLGQDDRLVVGGAASAVRPSRASRSARVAWNRW